MQIVSQPTTDGEVMLMDAMPPDVKIFILEHQNRRIYLVLDAEYARGGHPAVYNSPSEVSSDLFPEVKRPYKKVLGE